jgi:putative nucleotidyltransferase with HDIG domain
MAEADITEAANGDEALAAIGEDAYDLLMIDWNMPGTPGIDIVRALRCTNPALPIIMVSAVTQRDQVLEAMQAGVSDYIIKPFEPDYLLGKVQKYRPRNGEPKAVRIETLPAPFGGVSKTLLSDIANQIDDVSTIPQMAATFLNVANDPDVTVDKLEHVLSFDPALSTRVLRLINSSAFAMQQRVTNLRQAIGLLGLKQLRNLGIAVSVSQLFRAQGSLGTYNRTALWHHMVSVAICARLIAKHVGLPDPEDVFLCGLLHDIGIVMEDQYVHQQFCQIIRALDPEKTLIECEREYLAFDHATLGCRVAEKWKFPETVLAAILHHHDSRSYDQPDKAIVRAVELANTVCSAQGSTSVGQNLVRSVTPAELELPLRDDDLVLLTETYNEELAKSGSLFNL